MEKALEFLLAAGAIGATLAWPVVAAAALYWYREPLSRFLDGLGRRVTKFALFEFAIELATMPEYTPAWKVGTEDVRKLTSADIFDAPTQALFEQMAIHPSSDYAVVDLGTGDQWLTSRLFIFALMLERMRRLRCFVFVYTRGDVYRRFLGSATPEAVRWALARRYPWLELAYLTAYQTVFRYVGGPASLPADAGQHMFSADGTLAQFTARDLVQEYVNLIQQAVEPPAASRAEWERLELLPPAPILWERTAWLTAPLLGELLGRKLDQAYVEDSPDLAVQERAVAIARRPAPFVALVDDERAFHALVDRQVLLEKLAVHYAEQTTQK